VKFKHTKSDCPLCTWNNRSYMLPAHIISHHTADVKLRKVQTEHCIYAYVMKGTVEHGFCVCLTCKKGMMSEDYSGHCARWLTIHGKRKDCKSYHKEALKQLKDKIVSANHTTHAMVIEKVSEKPHNDEDPVEMLWNKCKEDKACRQFMIEVEQICTSNPCYDDSDEEEKEPFEAAEGIKSCIGHAIHYKKELDKVNCKVQQIETENDTLKYDISTLNTTVALLKTNTNEMYEKMSALETKNKEQADLIAQLQKRIQQLEENQAK
jgi:hypothetical protein